MLPVKNLDHPNLLHCYPSSLKFFQRDPIGIHRLGCFFSRLPENQLNISFLFYLELSFISVKDHEMKPTNVLP